MELIFLFSFFLPSELNRLLFFNTGLVETQQKNKSTN